MPDIYTTNYYYYYYYYYYVLNILKRAVEIFFNGVNV
jgi:hypothetical protein